MQFQPIKKRPHLRNQFLMKDLSLSYYLCTSVCVLHLKMRSIPAFIALLALVDDQQAPHGREQLEETLQEDEKMSV